MSEPVVFREEQTAQGQVLGIATLNAEKSLNALSLDMINALQPKLTEWAERDEVVAVWLEGAGEKAFCAGGDIVAMYKAMKALPADEVAPEVVSFFTREYELDYQIRTFPKPVLVWGHGFVMGGGIGLMNGASHRVVTETSRLAMPEVTIGLYPDVGGTWFLNQMPGRMGLFLGLTGSHMNAADALYLNMADYGVASTQKEQLQAALQAADWNGDKHQVMSQVLTEATTSDLPAGELEPRQELIDNLMSGGNVVAVSEQLLNYVADDKFMERAQKTLANGCPITAHLVWEQLQVGTELSIEECYQLELTLSVNCAVKGDFVEGIRALLIDKDKEPNWRYPKIGEVPPWFLDEMFTSPWPAAEHPLRNLGKEDR